MNRLNRHSAGSASSDREVRPVPSDSQQEDNDDEFRLFDGEDTVSDEEMKEAYVDREDIDSEGVADLSADSIIRLFSFRLATYDHRNNYSVGRCVGEVAREFRDDYKVNILRILDEWNYMHPRGFKWSIGPFQEDTIRKFDPVFPESREEGGTADIRSGDVIELDGDGLVVIGCTDTHAVAMNKEGEFDKHSLAAVRELFAGDDYPAKLIRGGEVVRGDST